MPNFNPTSAQNFLQTTTNFQMTAKTTAQQLPNNVLMTGISLLAPTTNTGTIYIGTSTVSSTNGFPMVAGALLQIQMTNPNQLWMIGSNTTDILAGIGV